MHTGVEYNKIPFVIAEPQLRALWHDAFGDSDEYIDGFFAAFDADSVLHTLSCDGKLLSMLYALPYELHTEGRCLKVAYLYAVATVPAARGRGYMSRLFSLVHENLRGKGYAAAFLLPAEEWLWNYYKGLGYSLCSWRSKEPVRLSAPSGGYIVELCSNATSDVIGFIKAQMLLRGDNIIHSDASIGLNIMGCMQSGGGLFVARSGGDIAGVAFVAMEDCAPLITDILYSDNRAAASLLSAIGAQHGCSSLYLLRSGDNSATPLAMIYAFDEHLPSRVNMQLMLDV